ncbi:MAG: hypothetical protein ABIY50_08535 [Ignavibacteria bacterium]
MLLIISGNSHSQWVQTNGPGAGKTDAMITVNDIMMAGNLTVGGSDGRVYRSTDLGNEWVPADNGMVGGINNSMSIYDFDNVGTVIFAANGASGVHRTFDYGNNWERVNSGLVGSPLSLLSKDNLIFVGQSGPGVYVSTNLGVSWTARNNGLPGTVIPYEFAKLGDYIYVGLEGGGGPAPLYRSSNNGLLWEISNTGLPLGSNVHEFAVNGNTIFTSIIGDFGDREYGMFKSTDFGSSWTAANNGIVPYVVGGNAGEIFAHEGNVYLGTTYPSGERMFKSTNNGDLWFPITNELGNQEPRSFTVTQNYIFTGVGQYRSVFRTSNGGASWQAANNGLTESWSRSLMYFNGVLYGGEFEGLFYTTDMGDRWTEVRNGLPFALPITDVENDGINIYVTTDQYGVYRSTNNGASWTEINSGITGIYTKSVEALTAKENSIYIGTWNGVFKSTNKGDNWTRASSGLPPEGVNFVRINCITSFNGNLFAGTTLQKIFKSTNNGASWFFSGAGIGTYGSTIRDIAVKGSTLFITTDGGIYKSTNEGLSWTLLTAEGLTSEIISIGNNILASNYGATVLTGYNLILSTNDGASWTTFNTGLRAQSRVMSMLVVGNTLFGGTDTRSVWKRDVSSLLPSMTLNLTLAIQGFYNPSINNMIADTMRAILRSTTAPYIILDSAKAVINTTGNANFIFTSNLANGTPYYIQVKHRNSIQTWSKNGGEIFSGGTLNYNFSTASFQAYGSNQIQVDNSPIKFAVYSGDVNQDEIIDGEDLSLADNDAFNFMTGYLITDVNGDNIIDASDLSVIDNNVINFIGLIRP